MCARPHPRSIPSPSLKRLLSLPENMQICESRLQPTPVLALQSSVLQDLVGEKEAGCIPLQALGSVRARRASSSFSAHWEPLQVTGIGGEAAMRDICTSLDTAKCQFSSLHCCNGCQRGRLQGETSEIASVKRAGKMTEAWYLISEGYKLLITLPRCVIMMEDTVNSGLMDESAPVLSVLNSAIKQNNITSDLSILEGWIALCNVVFHGL